MLTPLGRVLALAQRRGIYRREPTLAVAARELPKGVAKDAPRVLLATRSPPLLAGAPDRYRPIIGVAVFAGLRQAEVLGLRWCEVDLNNGGNPPGASPADSRQPEHAASRGAP